MAFSSEAGTPWSAWRDGIRRVNSAPLLLVGMCTLTLLVALPLSMALRVLMSAQLGDSMFADTLAEGASYDWWQEFLSQATGLGTTFVPSIIGFGAVINNLGALLDNLPMATTIVGATSAWLVLWSFLSGGVLDRYARNAHTARVQNSSSFGLASSAGWLTGCSSAWCTRGCSRTCIRGPRATSPWSAPRLRYGSLAIWFSEASSS